MSFLERLFNRSEWEEKRRLQQLKERLEREKLLVERNVEKSGLINALQELEHKIPGLEVEREETILHYHGPIAARFSIGISVAVLRDQIAGKVEIKPLNKALEEARMFAEDYRMNQLNPRYINEGLVGAVVIVKPNEIHISGGGDLFLDVEAGIKIKPPYTKLEDILTTETAEGIEKQNLVKFGNTIWERFPLEYLREKAWIAGQISNMRHMGIDPWHGY